MHDKDFDELVEYLYTNEGNATYISDSEIHTRKRIIEIIDKQYVESKRYFAGFSHRESDKKGVYFPVLNPNPLEAQLFELDYTKDPGKQIHFDLILKNLQTLNIKYSIKIFDYKIYNVEE